MSTQNTVNLILYNESDEEDVVTLKVPGSLTLDQFKKIRSRVGMADYSIRINGEEQDAESPKLCSIIDSLNAEGMGIVINGNPATGSETLGDGDVISTSGQVKGN